MNCRDISEVAPLYLSGELDENHAARFGAHLAQCQACAQQVEQERRIDARLRESILAEEVNATPVEARVRGWIAAGQVNEAPRRVSWRLAVAATILLLLTAAASYRVFLGTHVPPVYADAADDHQDEVIARQQRVWLYDRGAIAATAARHQIPVEDISALESQGYRLERGKLCRLDNQIYLHLVFTAPGQEFSLFLRHVDGRKLSGIARAKINGKRIFIAARGSAHVAGFQSSAVTAFIVTDDSEGAALHIAELAATTL